MPDRGPDKTEWPRYFTRDASWGRDESNRALWWVNLSHEEARELDDKLQQMRGYVPARRVQQDAIKRFNER